LLIASLRKLKSQLINCASQILVLVASQEWWKFSDSVFSGKFSVPR
jgi:hypothetical protein